MINFYKVWFHGDGDTESEIFDNYKDALKCYKLWLSTEKDNESTLIELSYHKDENDFEGESIL